MEQNVSTVLAALVPLLPDLEAVYKDLHGHPELSMQETRTADVAANRLRRAGYEVTSLACTTPGPSQPAKTSAASARSGMRLRSSGSWAATIPRPTTEP